MAYKQVLIDGAMVRCRTVESLGYSHDSGLYGAIVLHGGRELHVVKRGGLWTPWTAHDRVAPLVEALVAEERQRRERAALSGDQED